MSFNPLTSLFSVCRIKRFDTVRGIFPLVISTLTILNNVNVIKRLTLSTFLFYNLFIQSNFVTVEPCENHTGKTKPVTPSQSPALFQRVRFISWERLWCWAGLPDWVQISQPIWQHWCWCVTSRQMA